MRGNNHRKIGGPDPADDWNETALLVYGSLMDGALRERLLGRDVRTISARLSGYERRRARYYYIVRCEGAVTDGIVLLDLAKRDFEILDNYEQAPDLYTRERIEVMDQAGRRFECWVYIPRRAAALSAASPSRRAS